MEKFMLIIREDLTRLGQISDEERFSNIPAQLEWIKSIADSGNYLGGQPLAISGRYVSRDHVFSDGPFIESKEGVSGFNIILAENINQAVEIAQSCPLVVKGMAVIEVRPIQIPDNLREVSQV